MSKPHGRNQERRRNRGDAFLAALIIFIVGYLAAEAVLQRFMHPLHWLAAGVLSVLVYFGVLVWFHWRRVWREEHAGRER